MSFSRPISLYGRLIKPLARLIFKLMLGRTELPVEIARKRLDSIGLLSKRLAGMSRVDVEIGAMKAQWLSASEASIDGPVILYLHGGGYVSGSVKSHWELAGRLTKASGAHCLIIDYRLAPEHPFPAALDDSIAAWYWLLDQGVSPEKIVIAGDSAGGGLALSTSLQLRELGLSQSAGIYCMSPWTDISLSGETVFSKRDQEVVLCNPEILKTAANDYAAGQERTNPLMSPLFANLQDLPQILIHTGTDEVLLDDSRRFHALACLQGVECKLKIWDGMWHVWPLFARFGLPEARLAIYEAAEFINSITSEHRSVLKIQAATAR